MNNTTGSRLYGFEDYGVLYMWDEDALFRYATRFPHSLDCRNVTYLPMDAKLSATVVDDFLGGVTFRPCLYENHPELLDTAKKVYVHPSCSLSRSMMAEKYGKCLNPWLADALVVPTPSGKDVNMEYVVLFCNDAAKLIVMVRVDDGYNRATADLFQVGSTWESLCKNVPANIFPYSYKIDDLLKAEFFYAGKCISIPNSQSYILEVLTNSLPTSKTVFEESVQSSLSTEDNQLTLESLINIRDMLNSSDDNTVSAGLKALSMMDYIHYPNSVRYTFRRLNSTSYKCNKAASATSVKFMFQQLSPGKRRYWPGDYDSTIYEKDYKLLQQLVKHFEPAYAVDIPARLRNFDFMTTDGSKIVPRLRQ